jgi:DNA invertase Pin-like site-specific DNA recombinase
MNVAKGVFTGISFQLPSNGKLEVAREIGRECGAALVRANAASPLSGFSEEVQDWSDHCRNAWRAGLIQGWHAAREAAFTSSDPVARAEGFRIGYARVSTQDQNTRLQLDALTQAGCARVFAEKASGAQRERPQLRAALDYMRPGDALVVWKLDRLARSLKQLIETVEELEQRGIGFLCLTEAIDTTSAGGKLVFHIFASLAEFERSIIRERTRAGLAAARARGRVGGRPPALSEQDLQQAKALLNDPKITVAQVARRLGVGASTLYRHLPGGRSGLE